MKPASNKRMGTATTSATASSSCPRLAADGDAPSGSTLSNGDHRRWPSSAPGDSVACADSAAAEEHRVSRPQLHEPRAGDIATAPAGREESGRSDLFHQGADHRYRP